ncbi:MAG: heterodisulfide reductase-related iron-sulfur binding cluster [candidate division Zixibacteria bacterium]
MPGPIEITPSGIEKLAFIIVFAIGLIIFVYEIYFYARLLKSFAPENRWDRIGERVSRLFKFVFAQRRLLDQLFMGIAHFMIFWGFLIISFATLNFFGKGFSSGFELPLLGGILHKPFMFMVDLFSLLVLIGIVLALIKRYFMKTERMSRGWEPLIIVILIGGLMIFDLFSDGFNMATQNAYDPAAFAASFLGQTFAEWGMSNGTLLFFAHFFWWAHAVFFLTMLNYVPVSKHMHVLTSLPNVFFSNLDPDGKMTTPDLEADDIEEFGVTRVEQFSWKNLLDGYSCTECGRCQDQCPAYATGKPLSPKKIIMQLREHAEKKSSLLFKGKSEEFDQRLIEDVITEDVIWDCTTCDACVRACPLLIEQFPILMELRRALVLNEGRISSEGTLALKNIEKAGDPWGLGQSARADWYKDLDVKHISDKPDAEYLFWVGCAGALDARNVKVSRATVELMNKAGVSFAILGTDETCTGDPARRLGEEYLFQTQAQGVVDKLNEAKVKKIFTGCPHCFNTFKNEMTDFGGNYEVYHVHQLLAQLLADGKLKIAGDGLGDITFHDSCYLGRHNNIFDPAREIIDSVPGSNRIEMKRSGEWSFCCGAGGGRMFMEETTGERINENRAKEAVETGAKTIGVSCPFCMTMMTDGLKALGKDEDVDVQELTELLAKRVE